MTSTPEVQHRTPGERGHGIRAVRSAAGLTATDVAAAIGVRASTVYNWEHGRCRVPEDHLPALARALGSTPEDLRTLLRGAAVRPPPRRSTEGLALLRRRSGLSRRAVALRLDVSIDVLGRWEREGPPTWHVLRRLASAYGVSVEAAARAAGAAPPRAPWTPGPGGPGTFPRSSASCAPGRVSPSASWPIGSGAPPRRCVGGSPRAASRRPSCDAGSRRRTDWCPGASWWPTRRAEGPSTRHPGRAGRRNAGTRGSAGAGVCRVP